MAKTPDAIKAFPFPTAVPARTWPEAGAPAGESLSPSAIRRRLRHLEGLGGWLLWACDLAFMVLAWEAALLVREALPGLPELIPFMSGTGLPESLPLALLLGVASAALYVQGCYGRGRPAWMLSRLFKSVILAWLMLLVVSYAFKWVHLNRPFLLLLAGGLLLATILEWLLLQAVFRGLYRLQLGGRRVLVVGSPRSADWVLHDLKHERAAGVNLLGLLTDEAEPQLPEGIRGIRIFKGLANTARLAARIHAEEVVLCLPDWPASRLVGLLQALWPLGVQIYVLSPELSVHLRRAELPQHAFHGLALLDFGRSPIGKPGAGRSSIPYSKRLADLCLGALLLLLSAPGLALIALAIWISQGRPIFYRQLRVGFQGKTFPMWKFRTMRVGAEQMLEEIQDRNEADGPLFKIRSDPRITPLGSFLRRHSLDEFPQLWNVLRGEMSLVGPRPPLPSEVARYESWHHARLSGAVGCTGLWQVSGRSDIPFDEMVLLDLYYLHNIHTRTDLQILFQTVWAVLAGKGAY